MCSVCKCVQVSQVVKLSSLFWGASKEKKVSAASYRTNWRLLLLLTSTDTQTHERRRAKLHLCVRGSLAVRKAKRKQRDSAREINICPENVCESVGKEEEEEEEEENLEQQSSLHFS